MLNPDIRWCFKWPMWTVKTKKTDAAAKLVTPEFPDCVGVFTNEQSAIDYINAKCNPEGFPGTRMELTTHPIPSIGALINGLNICKDNGCGHVALNNSGRAGEDDIFYDIDRFIKGCEAGKWQSDSRN